MRSYGKRVAVWVTAFLLFSTAGVSADDARVVDVESDALSALVERGVTVIDVRTPREWRQTGVIAGSRLITAFDESGRFSPAFPAAFQDAVLPDQEVIVICATGGRSSAVSDLLTRRGGYAHVYNAVDGIMGWIRSGSPVQPCQQC